ncbi:hypothetical protein DVH05_020965 [Phytophthora capsici]|nr:hypothetical protein DVH05_020965 [Phytophthora capsici]|eukprot:jgi/Phyca11/546669/estExt2_Genewise1Plus.C_PHYCAscaffold_220131
MTITKRVQKELVQAAPPADTQLLQKLRKNSHALQRAHKAASKNKGKAWTREEHARFLVALDAFPSGPWKAIADFVGTKDSRQTMTHAQKYRQKHERQQRGLRNHSKGKGTKQTAKPAAVDTEADVMMAEVTDLEVQSDSPCSANDNRDLFADESLFSMTLDAGAAWLGAKTDSDLMEIFAEYNEPVTDATWPQMWSTNSLEEIVASCSQLDFLA